MQSRGISSAQQLAEAMGVNRSTVSRGLADLGQAVLRVGAARSARYALRRPIRNLGQRWPLHRIDGNGRARHLGELHAVHGGFCWEAPEERPAWLRHGYANGFFPGLPFFLADLRPQGFLGRALARAWGPLHGCPADLSRWQEDDALTALLLAGDDLPGDFILGDRALAAARQAARSRSEHAIPESGRSRRYAKLAEQAMQGGAAGSSAGGEQPKFTTTVHGTDGEMRAVLVKFSPPMNTPSGRRWADLLAAEWLALRLLAEQGHAAAQVELLEGGGRRFLEVTRFDRHGASGRRGVLTLQAIEAGLIDEPAGDWPSVAQAMENAGLLTSEDARALCRRWCFGQLIANTDMHLANASVWFGDVEPLALAPTYDMLPMQFVPGPQGEIVPRNFLPVLPPPRLNADCAAVTPWAMEFWRRLATDGRISPEFQEIGRRAGDAVARLAAE
jgi:hypothetical protein